MISNQQKSALLHILFWVAWIVIQYSILSSFIPEAPALRITITRISFQIVIFYLHVYVLIPQLFIRKRYVYYAISIAALIFMIGLFRKELLELFTENRLGRPRRRPMLHVFPGGISADLSMTILSGLYYFTLEWFKNQRKAASFKSQQLEAELTALKNQINPHFLFNTLNNIYTLCLTQDDKAAPIVMKLSEMMRYMLDEQNQKLVRLTEELKFLDNLIVLQHLKTDYEQQISFVKKGVKEKHRIVPLLLLTFFENAFKHSDVDSNPDGKVEISLRIDESNTLKLIIRNTKGQDVNSVGRGIGLENVRKRLALLYPEKYALDVKDQDSWYEVNLTLLLN